MMWRGIISNKVAAGRVRISVDLVSLWCCKSSTRYTVANRCLFFYQLKWPL